MIGPGEQQYRLPESLSHRIFTEEIQPTLPLDAPSDDNPSVIVITGQPGAGKTTLARKIMAVPEILQPDRSVIGRPAAVFDVDMFKYFHPGYRAQLQRDPRTADDLVRFDSRIWFDRVLAYFAERGVSLIVEHGLRDRETTDRLLSLFADEAGYRVHAAHTATPGAMSLLGILERLQIGYEKTGLGRYVTQDLHYNRLQHHPTVADWLDADTRVLSLSVHQQNTTPVHYNRRNPETGLWLLSVPTRRVIADEQARLRTLEESRHFLRVRSSLGARMPRDWQSQLEEADAAAGLLDPEAYRSPIYDQPAVTFGRYQIVSIAHLDTVRTILRDWPKLALGVIDEKADLNTALDPPPHLRDFYRDCDTNTSRERNPMTTTERVRFWRAALREAGMDDRVTVHVIPRPELDPDGFNRLFPSADYHLVFPAPSGEGVEGFDQIRNNAFGEILDRTIHAVTPPLEYHTSYIKHLYRSGDNNWSRGLAPGVVGPFVAARGPERLLADKPTPKAKPVSLRKKPFMEQRKNTRRFKP